MTFTFETLPFENKEELRQRILTLFDRDIATVSCSFSSRNYAFIFGAGSFPAVIRVGVETPHRGAKDILSELMWIDDLKNTIPNVCQPLPSRENRLVECIAVGEVNYLATMFRKANGAVLQESEWDANFFYHAGALLGKIHRASHEEYMNGFRYKRKHWDESPYFDFSLYDGYFDSTARQDAEAILQRMKSIPRDPRWYGMIHGDYHVGNLFSDWGNLWAYDFDDCCYGYFLFDIVCFGHVCISSQTYAAAHPALTEQNRLWGEDGILTQIRAGYSSEYLLPDEQWALFDDFLRLRIAQILSIQILHPAHSKDLIIMLHEPLLQLLKQDHSPIEKIREVQQEQARCMSPQLLENIRMNFMS